MRVTIIPVDGFISIDGTGFSGLDLGAIDPAVHAVQWYDTEGEVEYKDQHGRITQNVEITDITQFQSAIDAWSVAAAEAAAEAAALAAANPIPNPAALPGQNTNQGALNG